MHCNLCKKKENEKYASVLCLISCGICSRPRTSKAKDVKMGEISTKKEADLTSENVSDVHLCFDPRWDFVLSFRSR